MLRRACCTGSPCPTSRPRGAHPPDGQRLPGLLRPPARPHRVLHARRRRPARRADRAGGRAGDARGRDDRPRQRLRRLRVLLARPRPPGVKPIIGIEAYFAPNISRFERKGVNFYGGGPDDVSNRGAYTHMTLLSESTEGMHNLFRLSTGAWRDGFFKHPRMDRELLSQHGRGHHRHHRLPLGRGPGPPAPRQLRRRPAGRPPTSRTSSGRDNYFLELMDHGLDIENRVRDGLLRLARDLRIPMIATNDSHYVMQRGRPAQEHLLCINSGTTMDIPAGDGPGQRFAFNGDGYYIKSAAEMRELWATVRPARGLRQHPADRRALRRLLHRGQRHLHAALPLPAGRERGLLAGQGGRARPARPLPRAASPTPCASRPTSRSASSPRWASRATSSSSPTSSTGPRTTASGSARAVAPARARWSPTRCGSPTSTRSSTA